MITNLFSIFDPSTPNFLAANWLSLILFLGLAPAGLWFRLNRYITVFLNLTNYIFKEFSPLIKKSPTVLLIRLSFFTLVLFNNIAGLFPYIFTASSHLVFTLSLALPSWIAVILYGWLNNTTNLLIHLIPQGTPGALIPFMVVIETVRNLIRPGTLAIRLTANIIAGHLLIVLLRSARPLTPLLGVPVLLFAQICLIGLEIAVALIQAYVFRVLVTLYSAECVN